MQCYVKNLEAVCTKIELETTFRDMYLQAISACNCELHIGEEPVVLPTIKELHSRLCQDISELLDWVQRHTNADKSGYCLALHAFIRQQCLSAKPDSLFVILENLEKIFEEKTDLSE